MKNNHVTTPTPISGYVEYLPAEQLAFQKMLNVIRKHYNSFGYIPIETPAVERLQVLTAKSGAVTKEIYGIRRLATEDMEDADKNLGLRFDLTVPLARYVAQHFHHLAFPFRRQQIQPVWRGERPQSGRYRQFYQADIDIVADGDLSLLYDAEMVAVIYQIFDELKIGPFTVRINNRKILRGFFHHIGVQDAAKIEDALRIVDKMEKIPMEKIQEELGVIGLEPSQTIRLLEFFQGKRQTDEWIAFLQGIEGGETLKAGAQELSDVVEYIRAMGVPEKYFCVDLSVARGLDYYTGTIYETRLTEHPGLGSIASGGRYDDLASNFIAKKLPGVGISIGVTRLFSRLLKAGIIKTDSLEASILITTADVGCTKDYLNIAKHLRISGLNVEVFFQNVSLGSQLKYANKKGIGWAIIANTEDLENDSIRLRNLLTGDQYHITLDSIVGFLAEKSNA